MKVLWVCNVPTNDALMQRKEKLTFSGGWLTGAVNVIKDNEEIDLIYCYPQVEKKISNAFVVDGVKYYEFYAPKKFGFVNINANCENKKERNEIRQIIEKEQPDIIHIWGTEYYHALFALEENTINAKVICSIQGLTSEIAKYYLEFVPPKVYHKISISCLVRGTLFQQMKKLVKRGNVEKLIIRKCKNFIGRTAWDYAVIKSIRHDCEYFKCNEIMRDSFYKSEWKYDKCCAETLFFSQGSSPLKGLNIAIEALAILKRFHPNIRLNIAGSDFIKNNSLKDKIKISTYGKYIKKIIEVNDLGNNIHFLGSLTEEEMVNQYLKCNIFLSCSSIENSSNSVCEAMLLGVPIISSYVGGVPSLIDDKVQGLMYQGNSPAMLAYTIDKMLKMKAAASFYGDNARKKALKAHDPEVNNKRLIQIYKKMLGGSDENN